MTTDKKDLSNKKEITIECNDGYVGKFSLMMRPELLMSMKKNNPNFRVQITLNHNGNFSFWTCLLSDWNGFPQYIKNHEFFGSFTLKAMYKYYARCYQALNGDYLSMEASDNSVQTFEAADISAAIEHIGEQQAKDSTLSIEDRWNIFQVV